MGPFIGFVGLEKNQCILYNGHQKVHAIKFQSVVAPNGLIANLYDPVEARRYGSGMFGDSGLFYDLQEYAHGPNNNILFVWWSAVPSSTTTYGSFSWCSKNNPSKFLEQSDEPIKCIGRMDFLRHSRLLQIPVL